MERYDVGSDQWTAITPMNCPRSALSVSVVDSRIYAIGKCSVAGHFVLARYLSVLLYMLHTHTHTHTRLTALFPGLPRWAGTRKAIPIWILLKQEMVSGSGISWAICKSAPSSRLITVPAPHHSGFYRPDALPAAQPTASKHWRHLPVILLTIFFDRHPDQFNPKTGMTKAQK